MAKATVLSPLEDCKTLHYAHTSAVAVDDIILLNGRVLVAYADAAANASAQYLHTIPELEAAVTPTDVIVSGDIAYWDNTNNVFTKVTTSNTKCGVFRKAKASGIAVANLELNIAIAL